MHRSLRVANRWPSPTGRRRTSEGRRAKRGGAFVLAAVAALHAGPPAAYAQAGWQTYVDPSFGTQILYPAYLFQSATPTATGVILEGREVALEVSVLRGQGIDTVAELRAFVTAGFGYDNVTYSPQGSRWLVLSGYRGDRVYYQKFFIVGDSIQGFSFDYPVATRHLYDPLVEILEDSFRAGPG